MSPPFRCLRRPAITRERHKRTPASRRKITTPTTTTVIVLLLTALFRGTTCIDGREVGVCVRVVLATELATGRELEIIEVASTCWTEVEMSPQETPSKPTAMLIGAWVKTKTGVRASMSSSDTFVPAGTSGDQTKLVALMPSNPRRIELLSASVTRRE